MGDSSDSSSPSGCPSVVYHLVQEPLWKESMRNNEAYFPPTYKQVGGHTLDP